MFLLHDEPQKQRLLDLLLPRLQLPLLLGILPRPMHRRRTLVQNRLHVRPPPLPALTVSMIIAAVVAVAIAVVAVGAAAAPGFAAAIVVEAEGHVADHEGDEEGGHDDLASLVGALDVLLPRLVLVLVLLRVLRVVVAVAVQEVDGVDDVLEAVAVDFNVVLAGAVVEEVDLVGQSGGGVPGDGDVDVVVGGIREEHLDWRRR
mmetsp:Transcript_23804/g.50190  ORF Transcript_23804/g.50190 Transcript_23804/m.50190 type:complete len:203 (+) Transcript_23804:1273-1881(+)